MSTQPTIEEQLTALYREAACHQPDAVSFLCAWHQYAHEIDDVVDEPNCEGRLETFLSSQARAACLYSSPFFQTHSTLLRPMVLLIASTWGDSVVFEEGEDPGLREYADSLRLCGNEMVMAVALICGGFSHLRSISARLRKLSWQNQHPVMTP